MKKCPTCGKTFSDQTINFCLADGTTLIAFDPSRSRMDPTLYIAVVGLLVFFGVVAFGFMLNTFDSGGSERISGNYTASNTNAILANALASKAMDAANAAARKAIEEPFGKRAVVITENANLRKSENNSAEVIQTVPKDTRVEWLEQRGVWFSVKLNGKTGWMHGNTIRLLPQTTMSTYTPSGSSDDIMKSIRNECSRQAAAGDQSPLCGDVERNGIR